MGLRRFDLLWLWEVPAIDPRLGLVRLQVRQVRIVGVVAARKIILSEALIEPALVPIDDRTAPASVEVVLYSESFVYKLLSLIEGGVTVRAPSVLSLAYVDVCELGVGPPMRRVGIDSILEQTRASLVPSGVNLLGSAMMSSPFR